MTFLKSIFNKPSKVDKTNVVTPSYYETHKDRIYPWIKVTFDDGIPAQIELKGEDELISKTWLGDLIIFYVFDLGDRFQLIHKRDLPNNLTDEQLHQLAVDNLDRDVEFELLDTNFGAYGLIAGGNHEAGAICLPDKWDWLIQHFNDSLIVAMPAKDLVLMVPETDTNATNNLKIFVHQTFQGAGKLLTRNIFRLDKDSKEWTIIDTVN